MDVETFQFGTEVSNVQEDLVRCNLKVLTLIESFSKAECHEDMEKLNSDIREILDLMRKGIQNLRDLALRQVNAQQCVMLKTDANSHEEQMTSCLATFKRANLACISRLNSVGREKLMSKARKSDLNAKTKDKEEMVSESGKATEQLRAISRHLAQTVQTSSRTMEELVESSKTLSDANEEFKSMGSVISQSRKLITKYGRRIMTDRVLIFLAAAFFFAVVFYILQKRVLGPLDPFSLMWSSITAFIRTVLNLLIPNESADDNNNETNHGKSINNDHVEL